MDAPTILREGTGYVVLYEQFGIEVRASNPTKRFGRPEMEVRITIPATGSGDGRVYWGGVGLMSKSNVKETITRCNRTAPPQLWAKGHEVEWDDIIDDLCWRLLLELRKPPVSVHVGKDAPPADKPVYQLYPLLQKDVPTIVYGDSGVGKSLLATFLAALVTNGTETTGLNPDPGNVLYMDWETSKEILHERIWAVKQGLLTEGSLIDDALELRYLQSETPLKEWADILPDMVATDNIDLLILDSLGMALSGSFNDGDVVVELFQIIRRLKCTTLIIDHQAKAEGSSEQGPIGSTYKKALARSVWEIRKAEGDGFRIGLYHRKSNRGRLHKPIGFEIDVDEDPYHNITEARFSSIQVSDDENLSKGTSAADQLANVLNSGTLSLQDIYDALPDIAKATLRATLSRHRRFLKDDAGHWGLTTQT